MKRAPFRGLGAILFKEFITVVRDPMTLRERLLRVFTRRSATAMNLARSGGRTLTFLPP